MLEDRLNPKSSVDKEFCTTSKPITYKQKNQVISAHRVINGVYVSYDVTSNAHAFLCLN